MYSSAPKTQTIINKTELPAWVDQAGQSNYQLATDVAGQLPGAYQGNLVAGMDALAPAFNYAQGLVGSQSGNIAGAQSAAANAYNYNPQQVGVDNANPNIGAQRVQTQFGAPTVSGQNFLSGNLDGYMNPYLAQVENNALANLDRQRLQALNGVGDQAIRANAFGGSRQGVMEGVTNAEAARAAGDLSANIRAQGFNAATGLMTSDMNRNMQGQMANQQAGMDLNRLGLQGQMANQGTALAADTANANNQMRSYDQMLQAQMANQQAGLTANQQQMQAALMSGQLATMAQGMGYNDAASLAGMGEQFRNYEQSLLAQDAARFDANKAAMLEPLNLQLSALGMSPYGSTSTQERTGFTTGSSPLTGALGGAAAGASIFSTLGGAAALGPLAPLFLLGGAALGGFGGSDERLKTDVQKMGKDKETGLDLYAYRYKGDPKTYPKVVGPMAQDVEKKFPGQVVEAGGRKAVNLGFGPMQRAFR